MKHRITERFPCLLTCDEASCRSLEGSAFDRHHRRVIPLQCVFVLLRVPGRLTSTLLFFSHRRKEKPCVMHFSSEQSSRCSSCPSFSGVPSTSFHRSTQPPPPSPVVRLERAYTMSSTALHQEIPSGSASVGVRVRLTCRGQMAVEHSSSIRT